MHSALYTILQNAFIFFSAKLSLEHFAECRCNFSLIQSCLGKFHMISSCFFFLLRKILLLPFDLCLIRIKAETDLESFLVVKFSLFNLLIQIRGFFDKLEYAVKIPQFGIYLIPALCHAWDLTHADKMFHIIRQLMQFFTVLSVVPETIVNLFPDCPDLFLKKLFSVFFRSRFVVIIL